MLCRQTELYVGANSTKTQVQKVLLDNTFCVIINYNLDLNSYMNAGE